MTIREYRLQLRWSVNKLARAAGIAPQTLSRIEDGEAAYDYTIAGIAQALSEAFGKRITIEDLDGVKIIGRD